MLSMKNDSFTDDLQGSELQPATNRLLNSFLTGVGPNKNASLVPEQPLNHTSSFGGSG